MVEEVAPRLFASRVKCASCCFDVNIFSIFHIIIIFICVSKSHPVMDKTFKICNVKISDSRSDMKSATVAASFTSTTFRFKGPPVATIWSSNESRCGWVRWAYGRQTDGAGSVGVRSEVVSTESAALSNPSRKDESAYDPDDGSLLLSSLQSSQAVQNIDVTPSFSIV